MGACGGSPLEFLMSKYGDDVGKFIAAEKGKEFIDQNFGGIKQKAMDNMKKGKDQALKQIDQGKKESEEHLKSVISEVEKSKPGVLEKAEKIQRKPKEEILGLNSIQNEFDDIKKTTEKKFSEQEGNVLKEMDDQKEKQKRLLDDQKPRIPIYDQLPEAKQKKVLKEGEKKFKPQIDQKVKEVEKEFEQKFNFENYSKQFGFDSKKLDSLTKGSKDKIDNAMKLATGGGMSFC